METSSSSSGLGGSYHHHRSRFGDTTLTKVFVGGLVWETPSEGLRHHFEAYGDILEVVVITGRETGCSKGYAEIVNPPWLDGSALGACCLGDLCRNVDETTHRFAFPISDAYPERSYYGGPKHICPYCHAVFWFQERVKNDSFSTQRKIVYNLCCKGGKVNLKPFECPPPLLADLLKFDGGTRSRRFLRLIRSYNSLFAFTSFGAAIDKTINNGTTPYVFKINGVVHHRIGTLLPQRGTQPKFAQLYTYDTEHETQNRLGIFETDDGAGGQPDPEMVSSLLDMLNENNSLVKAFRCTRERLEREGDQKITLRLLGCNTRHDVQYSLPSNGEIATIIVGDYTTGEYTYDVLVHDRECGLKRVSCLHPAYMPLQYPLLFPYGEHGFHLGIRYFGDDDVGSSKRKYVTMLEFVRRHMHYRLDEPNPYTCYSRLSDQIDVDAYSTIEGNRLQFIASHQSDLRSEIVQGIADAIDKGFVNADSIGGRVVVPASFTGGRRYHVMNYQDVMAIYAIGIVTSISVVALHRSRGQHTTSSKRTISLCSVSNNSSVNVVLWGGQASLFPGEQIYNDGQSSPQILMFVGTLVKKYADGLCLSGGSPCKWYINPDVPEASALMTSATKAHSPIKWNEVLSSNQPMSHVPEEQKIAYIRDLHPFENKDREFLVTVTVKKIGNRWWYNACKKCTRTAVAHGDSYKCSDQVCANIGTPNQSGVEDTPNKASNLVMPSTLLTPQSSATSVQDKTFGIGSSTVVPGATPAITKELTSTPRKRTRSSPAKTVTKRLFTDVDGGIAGSKDAADSAAAPSSTKDA
ncbi:hypothetical protein ZEAMMB73_Zm00001d030312 [Zea mays]|uniref:RRM domain-containing protein n=1 Tax=Zea mays TaxID=4577 RepID=A0A1D6KBW0_MAIZE|nr:hypothetical protein ZEAMMB73_Zm00001d030312 [Zea mays]ONM00791.1 hypothetical protein ZEAMMB73_Zm00001d030312 [Zea mays]